ncbi:hypothetical protein T440DRAFT_200690 [Plenodomus tracheiphilus IPT5]|uniref:ASX DEUBAD domain-containing protein n=1 Tax=Plenodomus tracheiphilus IPT5 TaxID=1408161 RepID=A0A6A7BHS9_9PLEO|nr:hypothetical protein T440DRAFT_200690 [Plenodomus tracheiphilus IPT5]
MSQCSSILSSSPSFTREMMSPIAPSYPTPSSAQSEQVKLSSPSAHASPPSTTTSTSNDSVQAAPASLKLSDPTTRKTNVTCPSEPNPKRNHYEVGGEENEDIEHPQKYQTTSQGVNVDVATPSTDQATPSKTKSTSKKTCPQPPTNANRPSRARKPPKQFWVNDDEQKVEPTKASVLNKKPVSKVFDPIFITSNSTSRLGKADVYHMLLEDLAWTSLTRSQQEDLLSMLPPSVADQEVLNKVTAADEDIARPSVFTLSNDCFRTDVAKFKEDLKNGHLAKTWQASAEQAVVERATGKYDEWKAEEAELWWGQKSK